MLDILLTSGITLAIVGALAGLGRKVIVQWVTASVQHDFDRKLRVLQASIDAEQGSLNALRANVLATLSNRHGALDKRRLEAADAVWHCVCAYMYFKKATIHLEIVRTKLDHVAKQLPTNIHLRTLWESLIDPRYDTEPTYDEARRGRLFVSDTAWALFTAYIWIIRAGNMQVKLMLLGNTTGVSADAMADTVGAVLPHRGDEMQRIGPWSGDGVLLELEGMIKDQLVRDLSGDGESAEQAAQAARAMRAAAELAKDIASASPAP